MKNPWIIPATALAVGAIGGFISGKSSGEGGSTASTQEASPKTRVSDRSAGAADAEGKRSSKISNIEDAYKKSGSSSRIQALLEFYSTLSAAQLAEEAKKLDNLPMGERMTASSLLFGRWAEVDPVAAMAFSNTMGFGGAFVRPTILQSWASTDPANAAKYYSENPSQFAMMGMGGGRGMGGQGATAIIAKEWARLDPDAALAWANSLGQGKGEALSSVVGEVAKSDPKKAAELAANMDPALRGDAYNSIARQWGASNFDDAELWARGLPADQQARVFSELIQGLATTNPELAAEKIKTLEPGRETDTAIGTTAGKWAQEDPAAAFDWLAAQTSQRAQRQAMNQVIPSLVVKDPAAALASINKLAAGEVRDSAVSAYVESNYSADPSTLTAPAESISDERDRGRTVATLYNRWKQTDPEAANAYLQQSTAIPDNMKERLTQNRGGWGAGGPRRP